MAKDKQRWKELPIKEQMLKRFKQGGISEKTINKLRESTEKKGEKL